MLGLIRPARYIWGHRHFFLSRIKSEKGAVATEYALLLVLVALAIIAGAFALGVAINDRLDDSADVIDGPLPPPAAP
jgi:Flp pilus assembly pilin Flp